VDVFEKVSIKPFNLYEFKKKYDFRDKTDYDLSSLDNISALLLEDLFVKEEFRGKGHGTKFVEELKKQGEPIVLYSLFEAEEFWDKQGFKNVISYVYIWGLDH
jgi:GNAT superfamily N-acetyltransferase